MIHIKLIITAIKPIIITKRRRINKLIKIQLIIIKTIQWIINTLKIQNTRHINIKPKIIINIIIRIRQRITIRKKQTRKIRIILILTIKRNTNND